MGVKFRYLLGLIVISLFLVSCIEPTEQNIREGDAQRARDACSRMVCEDGFSCQVLAAGQPICR